MKHARHPAVIFLTLLLIFLLSSCASYFRYAEQLYKDPCKIHAYVRTPVADYLSRRFNSHAPVRVAIIPFSVPANLASMGNERPGLGNELAWQVHAKLLRSGELPVVEVFNRQDWPGKKEEFFTGNFGALALAREANYDLVLVGYLDDIHDLGEMAVFGKLIEVESGITVWYGKSAVETLDPDFQHQGPWWWADKRRPDKLQRVGLTQDLAACFTRNLLSEQPIP